MAGPIFWSADKIGNQHRQVLALIPYNALIYNKIWSDKIGRK
jgi:hypothetical protein